MAEDIREHPLALEGIRQMDDDATPLVGQDLIALGVVATFANRLGTEVDESLLDRLRVTTVGELPLLYGGVLVNLKHGTLEHDIVLIRGAWQMLENTLS